MNGLFIAFLLICLGGGAIRSVVNRVRPSGVQVEGRSISEAQLEAGLAELARMVRTGTAGDPSSIDVSFEPETDLGRRFKSLALETRRVKTTFDRATKDRNVADVLDWPRLASAKGRAEARAELGWWRRTTQIYFDDLARVMTEYVRLFSDPSDRIGVQGNDVLSSIQEQRAAMENILDIGGQVLDLADEAKPVLRGTNLVLEKDRDIDRFNQLTDRFNKASQEFVGADARRQNSAQNDMNRIRQKFGKS